MRSLLAALSGAVLLAAVLPDAASAEWDWYGGNARWAYAPAGVYDPTGWERFYGDPVYAWPRYVQAAPRCVKVRRIIRDGRKRRTAWVRTCS